MKYYYLFLLSLFTHATHSQESRNNNCQVSYSNEFDDEAENEEIGQLRLFPNTPYKEEPKSDFEILTFRQSKKSNPVRLSLFTDKKDNEKSKDKSYGIFPFDQAKDQEIVAQMIADNYNDIVCNSRHDTNGLTEESSLRYGRWLSSFLNEKTCLVYKKNGTTVGYIAYDTKLSQIPGYGSYGNIHQMAVTEEYRGKDYGKQLLEAACEKMSENEDLRAIFVMTTTYDVAHKFYKPNGFSCYIPRFFLPARDYTWVRFIKDPYSHELAKKLFRLCVTKFLRR